MRKHPTIAILPRVATKDYEVPNSNFIIPKGMYVFIPVYAIHNDPEIYENPGDFDPCRFASDQVKLRPSCAFIPFGELNIDLDLCIKRNIECHSIQIF